MNRLKQILHKLLFPSKAVVVISIPVAAVSLAYVFLLDHKNGPAAYFSYAVSAYALVIVSIQAARLTLNVQNAVHRNRYIHRYLTDVPYKTHISLYMSLVANLLYAAMNLFLGGYYRSVWFGTLAVYYMMLAAMRFLLAAHVKRRGIGTEPILELKRYRLCGVLLMLMNIALMGVVVLVIRKNEGFEYAGYLIYVMAVYAFYHVTTAIVNVVKYRKYKSPVMSAAKAVNLAAALVSMLALETAMLAQFSDGQDASGLNQAMTAATGGVFCIFILGMGAFMLINSTKQLKSSGR